jgi:hypothetical protein
MYFRREIPPALPILELRIAPDRAALHPGRVFLKSGVIHYQEVRECSTIILQFIVRPCTNNHRVNSYVMKLTFKN